MIAFINLHMNMFTVLIYWKFNHVNMSNVFDRKYGF